MKEIIIDLNEYKTLSEAATYASMGAQIKYILQAMFGGFSIPLKVKGNRRELDSFIKTLSNERKYMSAYLKYGLDDPRTQKNKYLLANAVKGFEKETGIKWPFK
jgi:hypothetical protein